MNFWLWVIGWIAASALVFFALSINGKTEDALDDGHATSQH